MNVFLSDISDSGRVEDGRTLTENVRYEGKTDMAEYPDNVESGERKKLRKRIRNLRESSYMEEIRFNDDSLKDLVGFLCI